MFNLQKRSLGGILIVVYKHGRGHVVLRQRDQLYVSPQTGPERATRGKWSSHTTGAWSRPWPGVAQSCVCFSEATRLLGGELSSGVQAPDRDPTRGTQILLLPLGVHGCHWLQCHRKGLWEISPRVNAFSRIQGYYYLFFLNLCVLSKHWFQSAAQSYGKGPGFGERIIWVTLQLSDWPAIWF